MICTNQLLFKRAILCTYSAVRTLHRVSASSPPHSGKLFQVKGRNLLVTINVATDNIPIAKMSSGHPVKIVTYEDVAKLKNDKHVLLIDVREPSELERTGHLQGSINIPSGEVANVLANTSPEEFARRFGRPKPGTDFPLVFSCQAGKRSEAASAIAVQLGYKNVSNYSGGWSDWEKKSKK